MVTLPMTLLCGDGNTIIPGFRTNFLKEASPRKCGDFMVSVALISMAIVSPFGVSMIRSTSAHLRCGNKKIYNPVFDSPLAA